jgi:hypothetical protein
MYSLINLNPSKPKPPHPALRAALSREGRGLKAEVASESALSPAGEGSPPQAGG